MLVLTLKPLNIKDEMIYVDVNGETIGIAVVKATGKSIRIGVRCKREFNIYRGNQDGTPTTTTDKNGDFINGDDYEG